MSTARLRRPVSSIRIVVKSALFTCAAILPGPHQAVSSYQPDIQIDQRAADGGGFASHGTVRKLIPLVALLAIFLPTPAWAQGGPPLLTGDPDTPCPSYLEIHLSTSLEK